MLRLKAVRLALVLLITGCGQSTFRSGEDPLAFLAPGSEIQLTRDLDIPAGETRVFFQRGKAIPKRELDYYATSCDLEVRILLQQVQTVSRDLFVTGNLTSGRESVVSLGATQLAENMLSSRIFGGRIFGDRGPSVHRYLRVDLHSTTQPDVMRLTCRGALDDYYSALFPSEMEIKVALGDIMKFL